MIIKIRLVTEREYIASVLVKNGYQVKQIKVNKLLGKGNDICLETNDMTNIIRIRLAYERQLIAGKLVKNGYQVEQIKEAKGRGFQTCLRIEEPEEMCQSAERGDGE